MFFRTDLAVELREIREKSSDDGITYCDYTVNGVVVKEIEVINRKGEKALGKPIGKYITVEVTPLQKCFDIFSDELTVLSNQIRSILPKTQKTALVACLGNKEITPDALAPVTAEMIFATRHIENGLAEKLGLGQIKSVAVISPGVSGKTGMEAGETIKSLVKEIDAGFVLTVDALASRRLERVGSTVQIATTGIIPGSGVGNARFAITKETMGVPVISMGIPTVVDGATMAMDIIEKTGKTDTGLSEEILAPFGKGIFVTPKDIDLIIRQGGKFLALAINCALQPSLSPQDIFSIVGL